MARAADEFNLFQSIGQFSKINQRACASVCTLIVMPEKGLTAWGGNKG